MRHLRHHVSHQKQHDHHGHHGHDGRVKRRPNQLGLERLLFFQVIRQTFEHQAQVAALLARTNDGHKDARKFLWMLRQRTGESGTAVDFGAQGSHQLVFVFPFGLVGQ